MAHVEKISDRKAHIQVDVADALAMVQEAANNVDKYASDIVTIYEKMPAFDYTSFCFYAYDSAKLFENMLGESPRQYNSFSLDAPDSFFFTLYGGMAGLYTNAKQSVASGTSMIES